MKKKKLPSLARLKRRLDAVFSIWIRKRDADDKGMGHCISCGKWALLQAGHFVPRQFLATRWEPYNVWGQCSFCNCWQHGNQAEYYRALQNKLGYEQVEALLEAKRKTVKLTRQDYETLLNRFKSLQGASE